MENDRVVITIVEKPDEVFMDMACDLLQRGELVAFPTETVYGLGGDALNPESSERIYSAKGRPSDNPLIVHIADMDTVEKLATEVPDKARACMEAFWPGPLTVILPKKDIVPDETTGGLKTVAIRMPSHPVAMELIKKSGVYIAAPSANLSGRPSPTTAQHVYEDMQGRIELILDGGPVGIGIESTIVDFTGDTPTILRPGFITPEMLSEIIGPVEIDPAIVKPDKNLRPKAPGMKYTHYAPKGELVVVEAEIDSAEEADRSTVTDAVVDKINSLLEEHPGAVVLTTKENADRYNTDKILLLGEHGDGPTVAARLYSVLRECDDMEAEFIISESFDRDDYGGAIMNRLLRAAGQRVIKA